MVALPNLLHMGKVGEDCEERYNLLDHLSYIEDLVSRHSGLQRGSWLSNLAGALLSGFVVAVVINPLDVVTTRLYNQPAQV